MKILLLIAAMTLLPGFVSANADSSVSPQAVTFDPKTIKPDTSVEIIGKLFLDSQATKQEQRPNGDTYLVLSNYAEGRYVPISGESAKVTQYTTLALVVGKDGKIKSYAMEKTTTYHYPHTESTSVTKMGDACFSDCSQSASKTLAASSSPVTKTPAKSVVSGSTPKEQTAPGTSPLQDQAVVSPSAP